MLNIDQLVDLLLDEDARSFNIEVRSFLRHLMDDDKHFTLFETEGGRGIAQAHTVEEKLKLLFLAIRWQRHLVLTMRTEGSKYAEELPPVLTWGGASFNQTYLDEALGE